MIRIPPREAATAKGTMSIVTAANCSWCVVANQEVAPFGISANSESELPLLLDNAAGDAITGVAGGV